MKRILSILFWSVLAAAFIGPGTVTTAASAGARFNYALLWALLFSTVATLVLQESSARVTVVSGFSLGQAIHRQFYGGAQGLTTLLLVLGAIVFGCAAYEAGNILGGVSGAVLGTGYSEAILTILIGGLAGVILWLGTIRIVAYIMSIIVALMGGAFLVTAFILKPPLFELFQGSFVPMLPRGSGLLVIGLIGTTVVPYNLFLGSGIAVGQSIKELRFGLSIAIILGGIISMAVLVVGTAVNSAFSYEALSSALSTQLGGWARHLFSFGLFAAGFSSAITAPLAAAVTAKSLFEQEGQNLWDDKGWRYRSVWLGVLFVGIGFGLADVKPIPAIILAQALNGIVLPFAAIFLLQVVNDRGLMGENNLNGAISNSVMSLVVAATIVLGSTNVLRAGASTLGLAAPNEKSILMISVLITISLAWPIWRAIRARR